MIICDSRNWESEKNAFHPVIDLAINWIQNADFSQMTPGKYDIQPGNKMFCLLQEMETQPAGQRRAESHREYVDIQYLLAGEETIGVAPAHPDHKVIESKPEQDIVFFQETRNESQVSLVPGMFAVFFPHDVHRPCCHTHAPSQLRKAVIKIHRSLFHSGDGA